MKKRIINYFLCILTAGGLSHAVVAQELTSTRKLSRLNETISFDSTRNQRMERDLKKRNSLTNDESVTWREFGYGYNGSYSSDNVQYMARYDQNGKNVETLTKKVWSADAPAGLKSSYDNSNYKSQTVTGYWEVTDPSRKGYYLELTDDQNNVSRVWVNKDGKFTTSPKMVKNDY
jgi:hypothetical protein